MEATMICIDNSEWTRSGDYAPTRFQAQADAVNLLAGAKTQAHPENVVGVLTMAGKTARVLVTPTPDLGKVLNCMTSIDIDGEAKFTASVQIAQLALKHRQNKNQRQRIVLFVGSPITEDKEKLVKIGKKLKKNNVAVDIVSFGCEQENEEKLDAFHNAVNNSNNSHLVTVPPGPVLSDVLISSPIFQVEGGSGYGFGASTSEGFEFGVDPNLDPELALAIRVSLEEERARQNAAAAAAAAAASDGTAQPAATPQATPSASAPAAAAPPADVEMDDDALLQQALAMSMEVEQAEKTEPVPDTSAPMFDAEDEELQMALQLSMQDHGDGADQSHPPNLDVNSVIASLPGVDPSHPALREVLKSLDGQHDGKSDNKKEQDKDPRQ